MEGLSSAAAVGRIHVHPALPSGSAPACGMAHHGAQGQAKGAGSWKRT